MSSTEPKARTTTTTTTSSHRIRRTIRTGLAVAIAALGAAPVVAQGQLRGVGELRDFATGLNQTCPIPEGVAVDERTGTVFASSLGTLTLLPEGGFTQPSGAGSVCVVSRDGKRVRRLAVEPGASGKVALFGMDYVRGEGLYVGDGADSLTNAKSRSARLLRIDPDTGAARVLATGMGAPIGVLRHGRWLYGADGLEGRILRMRPDGSASRVIARSRLLRPAPESPYGANGLAVDPAGRTLYVPNPGTGRILAVRLDDAAQGPRVRTFADGKRIDRRQKTRYSLAGPDDVAVDARGNVWITANDAEEIQALSPTGRLIARVRGIGVDATRNPTALAFRGRQLVIANFDARSATPGANSKLSIMTTPFPGLQR